MFYLNYKLRLLEKLLKVKCLFGGKEYPFQNIEPRAFFFICYLSYDSETYIKQGGSNVTINLFFLSSYIIY